MTTTPPDDSELLPLDVAARLAFPAGGVTKRTLMLRARQGKLRVYRPGKPYLTTLADVRAMVVACQVERKAVRAFTETEEEAKERARLALDAALATIRRLKAGADKTVTKSQSGQRQRRHK